MATWSSSTTYAIGNLVTDNLNNTQYVSLQNSNLNHQPSTSPTWWANVISSSKLVGNAVLTPMLQGSKMVANAVLFPALDCSKLVANAVLLDAATVAQWEKTR